MVRDAFFDPQIRLYARQHLRFICLVPSGSLQPMLQSVTLNLQTSQQTLSASDPAGSALFGYAVSLTSDGSVLAGAVHAQLLMTSTNNGALQWRRRATPQSTFSPAPAPLGTRP